MFGNEVQIRKDIINKCLQVTKWNINDYSQVVGQFEVNLRFSLAFKKHLQKVL